MVVEKSYGCELLDLDLCFRSEWDLCVFVDLCVDFFQMWLPLDPSQ